MRTRLAELEAEEKVVLLGDPTSDNDTVAYSMAAWQDQTQLALRTLSEFHRQYPLRKGVPREEMRSRLGMSQAGLQPPFGSVSNGEPCR